MQLLLKLGQCDTCKVFMPVDWKITDHTVVQPDALVVCQPFHEGTYLSKTPEIVFEILSPPTADKDRTLKYDV